MDKKNHATTSTRADLAASVYREIGLPKSESTDLVNAVFNKIETALLSGETVKLSGFGTFSTRIKRERMGRNPKTGESVLIPQRRVINFKPSTKVIAQLSAALSNTSEAKKDV